MIQSRHPLPSQWNDSLVASSGSRLYVDGPTVTYIGAGGGEREAASIRSDHPVPPDVPVYYFEMTVVSAGDKGFIGVGFSTENVNTARLPGWDQGSYGYHGDDGKSFEGSGNGQGTEYGLEYGDSDWIGVIYNQVERTISYTVNGMDQGVAFSNVTDSRLFPTVGMQSSGEQVVVDFGTAKSKPLRGDYNSIVDATRQRLLARVLRTPLTGTVVHTPEHVLRTVIVDFLIHHCCGRTAALVLQSMQHPQQLQVLGPEQRSDMQQRQRIMAAVEAGRIRDAMSTADAHAPGCIAANPDIQFKLHLQHFIELVRAVADVVPNALAGGHAEAGSNCNGSADAGALPAEELRERLEKEALAYSQTALAAACQTSAHMTMLTDALSLLAYPQPHRSPECHLLQLDRRELLAQELNGVLLRHRGQPEWPLLSTMCKQALAVHSELVEAEDLEAVLLPQVRLHLQQACDASAENAACTRCRALL